MQTLPESHQTCKVAAAQTSGPVNLVFFCLSGLFECEHLCIDKPMVITEPAVASTGLLGLSSKLHPSDRSRMLNKDLTSFMHSLS